LAACTDGARPSAVVTAPEAQFATASATCDYAAITTSATLYTSPNDPIVALIAALQQASNKVAAGLDVLARVAAVRDAGQAHNATDGAAVVSGVFACANLTQVPATNFIASALATDGTGGIFQVRGGPNDPSSPTLALAALPAWGAEPQTSETWSSSLGQRRLVIAYRIALASWTRENPALPNTPAPGNGTAFEISTVPYVNPPPHPLVMGVCVDHPASYRLQTNDRIVALIPLSFCSGQVSRAKPNESLLARLLSLVLPTPANAALFLGGTGGLPSGFSPKGAIDVNTGAVRLVISAIPNVVKVNTTFPVTVRAISDKGNAVDDVLVRLEVNGGSVVFDQPQLGQTTTVNAGFATFNVRIRKTGTFDLGADGFFNGSPSLPTQSGLSNKFTVVP
ncbi:MAG: hypothetical protein ABIT38_09185, partial [Gemmatimonadaceae bacterium]